MVKTSTRRPIAHSASLLRVLCIFFSLCCLPLFPFTTLPVSTVERCKVVHEVLSPWRKSCNVTIHMKPLSQCFHVGNLLCIRFKRLSMWTKLYCGVTIRVKSHRLNFHTILFILRQVLNLHCDYYNRGHLDKVDQSDYRKTTIHSEKVSCQS